MESTRRKPGERLADRYELLSLIGRGGIGEVWKARHLVLGSHVAIKFLLGTAQSGGVDRFLSEARIAATIKSRHAVQVFDFGVTDDGSPFLVMELLQGESLAARVARGPLSPGETVHLLAQAARALDQAHELGVVHRDFKPENVVLTRTREGEDELKVVDFGIAKLLGGAVTGLSVPTPLRIQAGRVGQTVGVLGTPAYMAPEQINNRGVGAACDVWALGVVAFQCLTGALPFGPADDLRALFTAITEGDLRNAAERSAGLPSGFDAWFRQACALEADRRFPTATAAVARLAEVLGTVLAPASRPSIPRPPGHGSLELAPTLAAAETVARTPTLRGGRRVVVLGVAGVATTALVVLGVLHGESRPGGMTVEAAAPSVTSAKPARIDNGPMPASSSPAAVVAYRAGLTAYRQGTLGAIQKDFRRAVELDPTLGAAWLRLAIVDYWNNQFGEARDAFQKAVVLRASLGEIDLGLLDAFEALIGRDPSDPEALARRVRALSDKYATNAEVLFYDAKAADERGDFEQAVQTLRRVTELDPDWAVAHILLGLDLAYAGDMAAGVAEFSRCAAQPSTGIACATLHARLLAFAGRCGEEEKDIRDLIAKAPTSAAPYRELANALASLERPPAAVEEALKQAEARVADEERERAKIEDDIRLALWRGQFDEARARAEALEKSTRDLPSEADHAPAARHLLDVYFEVRGQESAAALASDYLGRRDGWVSSVRHAEGDLAGALEVPMLAALRDAGRLSAETFAERRDSWARAWERAANGNDRKYVWYQAYAGVATSTAYARAALDALPRYAPLPSYSAVSWRGLEGRARLLAGDGDGALPVLERAAAECRALADPVEHTHAQLDLGLARERAGDTLGACASYASVLSRWGQARPRSVTAEKARERTRALRCQADRAGGP